MLRVLSFLVLTACVPVSAKSNTQESQSTLLPDSTVTVSVPTAGDTIVLEGLITVVFSPQAFLSMQAVSVTLTRDQRVRQHFALTGDYHSATLPFEPAFRINTGPVAPANDVKIVIALPQDYVQRMPSAQSPALLLREITGGPDEEHDYFNPHKSEFDPSSRTLTAWLRPDDFFHYPASSFGDGTGATREALLIVAATPWN